jgi:hypothetical protein
VLKKLNGDFYIMRELLVKLLIIFVISLNLNGCVKSQSTNQKGEELEEPPAAQSNENELVKILKDKNNDLTLRNELLEEQLKFNQDERHKLEEKIQNLEQKVNEINRPEYFLFSEGLFIQPKAVIYEKDINIESVKSLLGNPISTNEHFNEMIGVIEYEMMYQGISFTFEMHEGNKSIIKFLTLKNDRFVTQRGISVGSNREEVLTVYGKEFSEYENKIYYGDKQGLSFVLENNIVKEINIWFLNE